MVLIKSIFYVNDLTPSIINTRYAIFMHAQCVYSANNPTSLALYRSSSTTMGSQFLFVNINFFLDKLFVSLSLLVHMVLIWFLLDLIIFSWSWCNFLFQDELIMVSDFSPRRFVRLTIGDFCIKATTIMFIIFWDFLMVEQIFFSPQQKRGVIISNKPVYTNCLHELPNYLRLRILEN